MRNPIKRFAEAAEMSARRAQAGAALCFAIILPLGGMWLTVSYGINWFTMAADVLLLVFA